MTDSKVTDLTAATLPLTGSEVVYLVQGGNDTQSTTADIAALGGGLAIGASISGGTVYQHLVEDATGNLAQSPFTWNNGGSGQFDMNAPVSVYATNGAPLGVANTDGVYGSRTLYFGFGSVTPECSGIYNESDLGLVEYDVASGVYFFANQLVQYDTSTGILASSNLQGGSVHNSSGTQVLNLDLGLMFDTGLTGSLDWGSRIFKDQLGNDALDYSDMNNLRIIDRNLTCNRDVKSIDGLKAVTLNANGPSGEPTLGFTDGGTKTTRITSKPGGATVDRTQTLQDRDGVIALLDDIPSGLSFVKTTEIDFGTTPYTTQKAFTISDVNANSTSIISAALRYEAPTGRSLDEIELVDLTFACGQPTTAGGGSFQILATSLSGSVSGKYKLTYTLTNP